MSGQQGTQEYEATKKAAPFWKPPFFIEYLANTQPLSAALAAARRAIGTR
jgi:hypothetical protein